MKQVLILVLTALLLCGCTANQQALSKEDIVFNVPTDATVNGYLTGSALEEEAYSQSSGMPDVINPEDTVVASAASTVSATAGDYCGNTNSKVFHSADCTSVSNMKESNKIYFKTREEFIANGYSPCGRCNP